MKMKNTEIVLMDFSGIYHGETFYHGKDVKWIDVHELPGSSCYCDEEAMDQIREKIRDFSIDGIHFIDSGNYHYMSRIWLEKMTQPFRLLVFDNHTDMQPPAFGGLLSCGGWIAASIDELPFLQEVCLCGPEEEAYRQVPDEWKEKVKFLSKETRASWEIFFREIPLDLPLYLSIDKDILCPEDACTTWSQGELTLKELLGYLQIVKERLAAQGQQAAGVDICGECDPDKDAGSEVNDVANRALLKMLTGEE